MKAAARYQNGYEFSTGELELKPDALLFKRSSDWVPDLASELLSPTYLEFVIVPRAEIRGTYPSPNSPTEFAVYTTRGILLVFNVNDRAPWLEALGPLPPGG